MLTCALVARALAKRPSWRSSLVLPALLCLHVVAAFASWYYVTYYYRGYDVLRFDPAQLYPAILNAAPLAVFVFVFSVGRFSFGYFASFSFYTMILGYLFLAKSSVLPYDHTLGSISALVSILAFLAPAMLITGSLKQRIALSEAALERVLSFILILAAAVVAAGAYYHFKLVALDDIYKFRNEIEFPRLLSYAIGIFINALLPFAFACDLVRRRFFRAAAALVLLILFYPITLTKLTLFAPFWLLFLALLSELFEIRIVVVLSLLAVTLIGLALVPLAHANVLSYDHFISYFGAVNFRMVAIPSIALDLYSDFFSHHELTHFCQIQILKRFVACPYNEYLSVIMSRTYDLGAVNASLFATEGVASVGPKLAPLSALVCGMVVALANRLSAGLPPKLVLLSSGLLVQVLLNVPLTTSLMSNGAALLFALWFVTPRSMFDLNPKPAASA